MGVQTLIENNIKFTLLVYDYIRSSPNKMKNNSAIISIFWILLIFSSCQKEQPGFEISANLTGFDDNSKITLIDATSGKVLDSARLSENKFRLSGKLEDPPINLSLAVTPENGQGGAYSIIFIGNEKISIAGDRKDFQNGLNVTGSKYNRIKSKFDLKVNPLENERNEKLQQMFSLREKGKWNDSLQSEFWSKNGKIPKIDDRILEETKQFIEQNTNSDYALYQLVLNKTELPKNFIKEQIDKLNPDFKNTRYVRVLETFQQNKTIVTNDKFYDFIAENQNGQTVNFSDFFHKSKYVLLEFYSPYCGWCAKALPEIKELVESKNDKLEVITFSFDKNKKDWLHDYYSNGKDWTSLWSENGRYGDCRLPIFRTPLNSINNCCNRNFEQLWEKYSA